MNELWSSVLKANALVTEGAKETVELPAMASVNAPA